MSDQHLKAFLRAFAEKDHVPLARLNAEIGEAVVGAYIDVLTLLGVLDRGGWEVRTSGSWEHSSLFVRSLLELASSERRALGDFAKSGPTQSWVRALEAIEEGRRVHADAAPIRHQFAAQAVIVGASDENTRFVLMDYDPENWGSFRLVGGKSVQRSDREGTETSMATIDREVGEELAREHGSFFSPQVACTLESRTASRRLGAYSWYRFVIFRVEHYTGGALEYTGERRLNLRWVKVEDVVWALDNAPHLVTTDILSHHDVQNELTHPRAVYRMRQADLARVAVRRDRATEVIE